MYKRKILIIDDERGFSEILKINLESDDLFQVEIENNPQNATYTALYFQPDLILLDIIMAHKEGSEVAKQFLKYPSLSNIPVIFLTATVTQQEIDNQNGVIRGHSFVAKPSNLEVLLETIDKNLIAA